VWQNTFCSPLFPNQSDSLLTFVLANYIPSSSSSKPIRLARPRLSQSDTLLRLVLANQISSWFLAIRFLSLSPPTWVTWFGMPFLVVSQIFFQVMNHGLKQTRIPPIYESPIPGMIYFRTCAVQCTHMTVLYIVHVQSRPFHALYRKFKKILIHLPNIC
jgi:hypothetical protein